MVGSRYQLTQKIAQGGMAEVYCAEQVNPLGFRRTVAIKKILPKHSGSLHHDAMLIQEAKLLVSLNHPNIVKVYDLGCMRGVYFLVMEFIDGCDLRRILQNYQRKNRALPIDCAVLIASELCKALNYAHHKTDLRGVPLHLVHLDVSPKNILLSKTGEVKLTDFGIASFRNRDKRPPPAQPGVAVVRGKYGYMSPEQALGGILDGRSDIFSLGLVLYELLTGRRFYRSNALEPLQREHRDNIATAPLLPPEIPAELEYIVLRCLAFDPEDRYQDAQELYRDLLRFLYETMGTLPQHQLAFMMEELLGDPSYRPATPTPRIPVENRDLETITAYQPLVSGEGNTQGSFMGIAF